MQLREFAWTFKFLLIDAADRSKIIRDQYRTKFDVNLYPPFIFREHSLKNVFSQ